MSEALDTLLLVLGLIVSLWIALFGTAGAFLADRAGFSRLTGFLLGSALGPIGVIWIAWRGRGHLRTETDRTRLDSESDDPLSDFLI